jgi:sulfur carrier protein ThiS
MSDFNDFNDTPEEEGGDVFDDFLDGLEEDGIDIDPNSFIRLRTTAGASYDVPAHEPMTINDLVREAGVTTGAVEFYVNGNAVAPDYTVAPGGVVTAVGIVKGG